MADNRFFRNDGPLTLEMLVQTAEAEVYGDLPGGVTSSTSYLDVSTLESATSQDIAVMHNRKYLPHLEKAKAGIVIVESQFKDKCPKDCVVLVSTSPYRSFAKLAIAFYPQHFAMASGTDRENSIHTSAKLGKGCQFESGVVIGENVEIGDNTFIAANTVIGRGVKIGKNCIIGANVSVSHALIGDYVTLHTGVRIGQAGFGFHMDQQGHFPVPQLGRVIIHDGVDIGANTTVDRGSIEDTVIGEGARIDNLVMIAHNVHIGKGCVIVAQVGISGSTKIGDFSAIGGQAGLIGHLNIGKGVQVAAQSGIMRDIPDRMKVGGSPAVSVKQWHRQTVILEKLAKKGAND